MLKCDSEYYLFSGIVFGVEILLFLLTSFKLIPVEIGCISCLCCVPILVILAIITEIRCRKILKKF